MLSDEHVDLVFKYSSKQSFMQINKPGEWWEVLFFMSYGPLFMTHPLCMVYCIIVQQTVFYLEMHLIQVSPVLSNLWCRGKKQSLPGSEKSALVSDVWESVGLSG